jgi:hypothetical protein
MYSKHEASKIKQDFWTRFGQYMKPVQSAGGEKVNWPNYKTGIAHIYFRLRAEKTFASVSIEITHPVAETRRILFQQFLSMKSMLEEMIGEPLQWEEEAAGENEKPISRISIKINGVNIFKETDWPAIISFLKSSIMALDLFWSDAKMVFE